MGDLPRSEWPQTAPEVGRDASHSRLSVDGEPGRSTLRVPFLGVHTPQHLEEIRLGGGGGVATRKKKKNKAKANLLWQPSPFVCVK